MNKSNMMVALEEFQATQVQMDTGLFLLSLLTTLVAALLASAMYRVFYESRATGSQVHRAFPLLGISITSLFIGIQVSIPLSVGLFGTLSIIRFRTPIKEPEEIGFIMLVIAAAVASATFNFRFIVILYIVAFGSLLFVRGARMWRFLRRDGVLVITLPEENAEEHFQNISTYLQTQTSRYRMESSSSNNGATSIQLSFSGLKDDVVTLQHGLHKQAPITSINVFLDRPGGIR